MRDERVSVEFCAKCSSMKWAHYGEHCYIYMEVDDSGVPVLRNWELDGESTVYCDNCGGECTVTLVGRPETFRRLKAMDGKERILEALELLLEGELVCEWPDDFDELFDMFCPSKFGEGFDEKIRAMFAKLKLMSK